MSRKIRIRNKNILNEILTSYPSIPSSSSLVSSHATKAETFECNRLYILTPSKSGRVTLYLDPSVSTEDMTAEVLNFLLAQ